MKLTVKDRFMVLSILPKEGSYDTIRIIHNLRQSLSFSEEEHSKYGLKPQGDRVTWTSDGEAEIEIGPKGMKIIADALKSLDEKGQVSEDFIPLWEKFIPTE